MNINGLLQYKIVETDNFIGMIPRERHVAGANNLIIAGMDVCCDYLIRYTEHRLNGREIKEAHELALRGANVISTSDVRVS